MLELGVLVSGEGTNLQAILDAIAEGRLRARVRVVISNRANAAALQRARRAGVSAEHIASKDHGTRQAFEESIRRSLERHGAQWVVLAGFTQVIGETLLGAFPDRILNIHPALCPAFCGMDAQAQALAHGVKISGCTVHFVDAGTDTGPIVAQCAVPVMPTDTRETLASRILEQEHRLLPQCLQWIADGKVRLVQVDRGRRKVQIEDASGAFGTLEEQA